MYGLGGDDAELAQERYRSRESKMASRARTIDRAAMFGGRQARAPRHARPAPRAQPARTGALGLWDAMRPRGEQSVGCDPLNATL